MTFFPFFLELTQSNRERKNRVFLKVKILQNVSRFFFLTSRRIEMFTNFRRKRFTFLMLDLSLPFIFKSFFPQWLSNWFEPINKPRKFPFSQVIVDSINQNFNFFDSRLIVF